MSNKRVLIVDDNATIRHAVRPLFDSHPNCEVCGEAEHGREAVEKAPSLRPDLIILDLPMPVMSGPEAAPLLIKLLPNVWLILFTAHEGDEVQRLARAAGIHAVVPKSNAATRLIAEAEALIEQGHAQFVGQFEGPNFRRSTRNSPFSNFPANISSLFCIPISATPSSETPTCDSESENHSLASCSILDFTCLIPSVNVYQTIWTT